MVRACGARWFLVAESMLFVFTTGVDIELHARAQLGDAFDLFQPDEAEKSPF
jgi:hypothetical protein